MFVVYITGDCHADWTRFNTKLFPEQNEMTRDDFVIVCGDFGLWDDSGRERWWFDWFEEKNFTLLFVDGNHENFDRLYSNEFEVVDFHGGKAHKIRENIYHLMRGYVFDLCGKKFFAFGGASSHDIDDGVLDEKDYESHGDLINDYRRRTYRGEMLRINHISWWEQELPTQEEMDFGLKTLKEHNNKVDFIISHCCPQQITYMFTEDEFKEDRLTLYFDELRRTVTFSTWFFGHYHNNVVIEDDFGYFIMSYKKFVRVV